VTGTLTSSATGTLTRARHSRQSIFKQWDSITDAKPHPSSTESSKPDAEPFTNRHAIPERHPNYYPQRHSHGLVNTDADGDSKHVSLAERHRHGHGKCYTDLFGNAESFTDRVSYCDPV